MFSVGLLHPSTQQPQFSGQKLTAPFTVRIAINESLELSQGRTLQVRPGQIAKMERNLGLALFKPVLCLANIKKTKRSGNRVKLLIGCSHSPTRPLPLPNTGWLVTSSCWLLLTGVPCCAVPVSMRQRRSL